MAVCMVCGCNSSDIIYVKNGLFADGDRGGHYFIGTNFWYGAILGSEGRAATVPVLRRSLTFSSL